MNLQGQLANARLRPLIIDLIRTNATVNNNNPFNGPLSRTTSV